MDLDRYDPDLPLEPGDDSIGGGPTLRTLMSVLIVVLTGISISIAATLFVLPNSMNRAANSMESSSVSVRNAEAIEDALLEHYRTHSSVSRATQAAHVRQYLADKEASTLVESEREQALLDEFFENIRTYLALAERTRVQGGSLAYSSPEVDAAMEAAYVPLQDYIQLNNEQSREARQFSRDSVGRARMVGGGGAVVLLLAVLIALFWIHRYSLRAVYALEGAIVRFRNGDFKARAPVQGVREFREIADSFNQMASMLEHRRQRQLAFLAGIAHDLRNPLSVISMSAQLMTRDEDELPSEQRVRRTFEAIKRQTTLLERLVDDFLDASAIEAGSLTLEKQRCDAVELARDTIQLFADARTSHQVEFNGPEEPVEIECDATRIKQVLINLVSNALKYSPQKGKVELLVSYEEDQLVYAVSDEGIGIKAEDLRRIFEPFHRVDAADAAVPGAGLGLAVVERIVEAHDGTIDVESSPGQGSTFRVQLPR